MFQRVTCSVEVYWLVMKVLIPVIQWIGKQYSNKLIVSGA